jgi:hypothetical protein
MKYKIVKAAFAALVLLGSAVANAGLITQDYLSVGDSKLVRDTTNNLEWLIWTETTNISLATALSQYSEFHLADRNEINLLITEAGLSLTPISGLDVDSGTTSYNNILSFQSLFGVPFSQSGTNPITYATFRWDNDAVPGGFLGMRINYSATNNHSDYWYTDFNSDHASSYHGTGYALVRNVVQVPEPSILAIFAIGMIGLASRRFKKRS